MDKKIRNIDNWKDHLGQQHLDYNENYRFAESPPKTLNFQIKRFSYDYEKNKALKNSTKLSYSLDDSNKSIGSYTDILDLDAYFNAECLEEGQAHYQLTSFVKHSGGATDVSPDSGHYIAFVRRGKKWYKCDDDKITFVKTREIDQLVADAYILSYQRIEIDRESKNNPT